MKLDRVQQLCHLSPPPRPDRPLSGTRPLDTLADPDSVDTCSALAPGFKFFEVPRMVSRKFNQREPSESPIPRALLRHSPPLTRSEQAGPCGSHAGEPNSSLSN